jgi:alpha-1,3-mannosylglycoprotein beta-1,4-N-acetylglucosaminyltransferase C
MQMEDDVRASDGYFAAILNFIRLQDNDNWICLEFSELGFIGKLYHSKHIGQLSDMLIMFSQTQPVDYTYIYFNMLMGNGAKRIRKPTLFQHMGFHSSLVNKIQPLVDKYFDFPEKELNGDNPPAKLFTTLIVNEEFPPSLAYSSEPGHFWSNGSPKENDTFSLFFESAQMIDKLVIVSGSNSHPKDIIHYGILEAGVSTSSNGDKLDCEGLITLGQFQNGTLSIDSQTIRSKLGLVTIRCLQIRFTSAQLEWVVIKEIAIFPPIHDYS